MKKTAQFLVILMMSFFIISCGSTQEEGSKEQVAEEKQSPDSYTVDLSERPAGSEGQYLFKTGIIHFETSLMGMKQDMTMYIDNFGETTAVEVKSNIMGMKSHIITFVKDDIEYAIDFTSKTVTKKPHAKNNENDIDFTSLTEEMMKEMHLTYEGKEEFLGKMCDKFTLDNKKLMTKGEYLVWKGLPLKSDMKSAGMSITMIATSIDLDAEIPESIFEIPQNFKLIEEL